MAYRRRQPVNLEHAQHFWIVTGAFWIMSQLINDIALFRDTGGAAAVLW